MNKLLLLVLCMFCLLSSYAQVDSVEVKSDKNVFYIYKTYQDYLSHNHTNEVTGKIKYQKLSRKDTSIISCKPQFDKDIGKIWGFSDGDYIFVKDMVSLIGPEFWRLRCNGTNPYYFYKVKTLMAAGPGLMPLIALSTTAAIPPQVTVGVVMPSGKRKELNRKNLRKIFAQSPPMLDSLKKVKMMTTQKGVSLLRSFNNAD